MYSIVAAIMFGSAGIFVKLAYKVGLDSIDILIVQYIAAVILMFALIFARNREALYIKRTQVFHLAVLGIFGTTLMTLFYYEAFKYLSVAMVTILLFTYPIMILIYSIIFRNQKITFQKMMAVILSFAGCVLGLNVFNGSVDYTFKGIIFGLLSAVFYAFMNLYSEKNLQNIYSMTINAYSTLFSLITLVIYRPPYFLLEDKINMKGILYIILLAVVTDVIPLTLLYASIKYIGAVKTSIIGNLEIPASIIISSIVLKERVYMAQIIGALMILCSVYIITQRK
ncbi:DMT family transporter [Clostridium sp.]|uniref:DMT family transporter n=1 Tax=Clostridium sp. TaxID=1506 RepID=UPI0025C201B9|nr:DMT family transporter [Clostridium sp.]